MSKKSLFVQLGSLTPAQIASHLSYAADHPDIYNVCFTYIGDSHGNLFTDKIDAARPYFQFFDNVFFGTSHDYAGRTDPYGTDMLDASFRWRNLQLQKTLAEALSAHLKDVVFHWYIEHEAALNKLGDGQLRAAYEAYLIQSVRDLRGIRGNTAILWSPAVWELRPNDTVKAELKTMFANIKKYAADGRGVDWLHLQDTSGRHWFNPSARDIKAWYDVLKEIGFASLRINVEQFTERSDGSIAPGDRYEIEQRERDYNALGMAIGFCWEIRWWYGVQQQPAHPQLSELYRGCYGCGKASNISWTNRKEVKEWLATGTTTGNYSRRAAVVADAAARVKELYPLEVQGAYYMRPYAASVVPGRAVNSDHLTAGALDIFFRNEEDKKYLDRVRGLLDEWKRRGVVRYYIDLGANWAHRDHIHVSFQIGVRL